MSKYTSIQIDLETREKLQTFREYARETYDEILNKLMAIAVHAKKDEDGELSEEFSKRLKKGREQIRGGKHYSLKEILNDLEAK